MSGIIGKVGSKSGLIRQHNSDADLVYINHLNGTSQTIDSNEAITALNRTYTYPGRHHVWAIGGLTMTSSAAFASHVGIFLDGASLGHPDQHYTPNGEWWYMSWSFISTTVQSAGTHAVTYTGLNQQGTWNIIGSPANSQACIMIVPQ